MTDLAVADATEQAALVRSGAASALELVDAAIERAELRNPALNAIIHTRFERARAEATAAPDGPFRGVPIVVKDLDGPLAHEPYHLGNRLLRALGHVADHDSWLHARLRGAGCVVIGKTNAPELGLLPTTEPAAYGPSRNPWDTTRSPGGSSGGSAAAVAAGIVALGHAGDGGGSIRIPASMCGLFGLKPTRGRVSLGPDEGEVWDGLVVRHVLTRSVRDSAAVLDVIAGPMPGDPYSAPPPDGSFLDALASPVGQLRIGIRTHAPASVSAVHPACVAATEATARMLESLGHVVEPASPAALDEGELLSTFLVLAATAVAHDLARIGEIAGRSVQADDVEALTWSYAELAAGFSAADHAAALANAHAWSRRVAEWWSPADDRKGFDLLLTPTLAAPPPLIGTVDGSHPEPGVTLAAATPFAAFTLPFNITGQPAMSVPLAMADGLPVGTQLVGPTDGEPLLLGLAAQLEAAHPWIGRLPTA
ncbi:MAG TPA: amidase [Acidimicrobiia bacterium]|nr:amidase [Acidimicrobiia bacterium]